MAIKTTLLRGLLFAGITSLLTAPPLLAAEALSRPLVSGAALHGANGIQIAPDGQLYVTSAVGSHIEVREPASGRLLQQLGPAEGVFGPDDIAFGPDGRLYWTAFFTGEVMRLGPDGRAERMAWVGPGVNAITFSDDGRLFVTRVFLADELYEIFPDSGQPPRKVAEQLGGLNAMDFGPDGMLYGPLWFKGQVVRIDVSSGAVEVVAEGLDTPAAVKFSPRGELYAIDQHRGALLQIDTVSGEQRLVASPGIGADNFAFDAAGEIYITNAHEGSIGRVLPNGELQALSSGGLSMPAGVTVDAGGDLVVAAAQSLRRYDAQTGAELAVVHASIGDPRTVATPLTVSRFGEQLLTSSWFSNVVQLWDPVSGRVVASYRDFKVPVNAIEMDGAIVVAELAAHRVVRRTPEAGDEVLAMVAVPSGLAAAEGRLYVADWLSGTIYQVTEEAEVLPTPRIIASGLSRPEGMAVDSAGRLLVVEAGARRLLRIDPLNPVQEVLAEGMAVGLSGVPGYPPAWLMSSVAIDNCGRITVSQDVDNSLLRVVPPGSVAGNCIR